MSRRKVPRRTLETVRLQVIDAQGRLKPHSKPITVWREEVLPPAPAADATRTRIENAIEYLIALLDAQDGDPDLERDDEDACAAEDPMHQGDGLPGDRDDAEPDHEDLGADEDEGAISFQHYQGSGAGCPIFDWV